MSPSTFFFDLSGAIPWFLSGVLATLLLRWIWRQLRGHKHHGHMPAQSVDRPAVQTAQSLTAGADQLKAAGQLHAEQISALESELADAKTSAVKFADEKQKLEMEMRKLRELAKISPDDQTQMDRLRLSELTIRNQLADANAEMSSLRKQIQTDETKAQAGETELAKMASQLAMRDAELDRLEKQGGGGASNSEVAQLKAVVARLQTDLDAARQGGSSETANLRLEVSRLQSALAAAANASTASGASTSHINAELAKLKADVSAQSAELENRAHHIRLRDAELDRLEKLTKAGSAAAGGPADASVIAERDQLRADMAAARIAFENLKAEHHKAEAALFNVGPEIEELRKFRASHTAEVARLTAQVGTLQADLENFRRFKDALDTANRIAMTRS